MDYVPEATLAAKITSVIDKCLNGVAGSRVPNHLTLNPDVIDVEFMVIFTDGENAVSTESYETPSNYTDLTTDTPGAITDTGSKADSGREISESATPPSRSTTTTRGGVDYSDTERDYEEFDD